MDCISGCGIIRLMKLHAELLKSAVLHTKEHFVIFSGEKIILREEEFIPFLKADMKQAGKAYTVFYRRSFSDIFK